DQRQKFVDTAGVEIFDAAKHDVLVWLGCAGAFETDYQKGMRSLFEILRARQVKFGVLSRERCTGDPAKRTGNEYMLQELANATTGAEPAADVERVTFHDPCYLGRYAGHVDEPRALLSRFGGEIHEPERNRHNPYCCGAGGGLLFADKEEEPGSRISDVRFKQLKATGANTVVTACPFCSIMLKGAQASAPANNVQFVDLMTFVRDRHITKSPNNPIS